MATTYYDKPKSASYQVDDIVIESVTTTYSDYTVVSTETSKLEKIETFSGNSYNHWLTTISTTEPTVSTTSSRRFEDSMGTFVVLNSDSESNSGMAVYKTLKNDLGNKFQVGDLILDSTAFFSSTILYNGVTTSGYGVTAIKGFLNGVEQVSTNLGDLSCYSIDIETETAIKFGNAQNTDFQYSKSESGTIWLSNDYGRVKTSIEITEGFLDDGYTESLTKNIERVLISAPIQSNPSVISTYSTSEELLNSNMSGWVWLGAFPWIYNANTGDWGYFANQELYVWDAAQNIWLTFDGGLNKWRIHTP